MRGIKSDGIPILVARDVEVVRREAKTIINIPSLGIQENPRPGLGIIAVIGPGDFQGRHFNEALLCEVGLGQSRPYHEAKKPGQKKFVPRRRKWFSLSEEQYLMVAPQIFQLLQKLTDERVNGWKCGPNSDNPFRVRVPRTYWHRHEKTLYQTTSLKSLPRGIRFAVSTADKWLLSDIFWAELNSNRDLKRHLDGLARFIDLYFNPYKKGFSRPFLTLKRVKQVQEMLKASSLAESPYLLIELLRHLPGKEKNCLWSHIVSCLIPWNGEETKERILASRAIADPKLRLNGAQLRVKTGLDGRNKYQRIPKKRDHIVFEVFPNS